MCYLLDEIQVVNGHVFINECPSYRSSYESVYAHKLTFFCNVPYTSLVVNFEIIIKIIKEAVNTS